jgi:hypothetical protein
MVFKRKKCHLITCFKIILLTTCKSVSSILALVEEETVRPRLY